MGNIRDIFVRFILPYKKYVGWSFFFNFVSAIVSLFSFAAIIPVLQIIFGIVKPDVYYQTWDWSEGFLNILDALKNNFNYLLNQLILQTGPALTLVYLGVFLIVTNALKATTVYLGARMIIPLRTGVVRDLKNLLYRKIVSLPIAYFTEEKKGDIMSRFSTDVNEIEISILSAAEILIKNPLLIIVYLTAMFLMSWQLTLFVLILIPVGGWLIGLIGKNLRRDSGVVQAQQGELLSQLDETITGLRIVKSFNAETKMHQRFALLNEKIRKTFNFLHFRYIMASPLSEFMGVSIIALLLLFGGWLIVSGKSTLDAAAFIYYLIIFYNVINPAKDLSRAFYSIRKGMASLDRVDKILQAGNKVPEPENPVELHEFREKIEFRKVSFRYQSDWVLKDVNLTVSKGKTIAIVGQSGSGKTTLIDLLPKFYPLESGEILIDGINLHEIPSKNIRSFIGNVNQEAILFNDTFYNNIAFGVENVTLEQVMDAARIANANDFIMATAKGYETTIGERGSKLSGGQRQRISIARAILKNPPILILDEATSALDTESEKMVQEALENLMRNRTTLVVAHRLSTIKRADKICVLQDGRIVERGKHDDLMALGGVYKKLVDLQSF